MHPEWVIGAQALALFALEGGWSPALADETNAALLPGVGLVQGTILFAPVVLYAAFSIYRTAFNRNAKISDFLFLVASVFIFGNILSTFVFRIRLF